MEQLILHLIGDYVLQSDWMASRKTSQKWPAAAHALVYGLPFLILTGKFDLAIAVIIVTHFLIDHYRLARYIVYAKNLVLSSHLFGDCTDKACVLLWANCEKTGYPSQTPPWMAVWLLIIADNTLHLAINFLALKYLSGL